WGHDGRRTHDVHHAMAVGKAVQLDERARPVGGEWPLGYKEAVASRPRILLGANACSGLDLGERAYAARTQVRDERDEGVCGGQGIADGTVPTFDLDAEGAADTFEIVVRAGLGGEASEQAEVEGARGRPRPAGNLILATEDRDVIADGVPDQDRAAEEGFHVRSKGRKIMCAGNVARGDAVYPAGLHGNVDA